MIITNLRLNSSFRYFWLKTVTGTDLSVHCAKCLIGEYDNRVGVSNKNVQNIELDGEVYYMCGVSSPYKWENNFHCAFIRSEGKTIDIERNGVSLHIEGAEELPISTDYIDPSNKHAAHKTFATCRNWQFAHWFQANVK